MRIAIDLLNGNSNLSGNEKVFLTKSFHLLAAEHPEHEWVYVPSIQTQALSALLPMGIKKSLQLRKLRSDVLISDYALKKKLPGCSQIIFFCGQDFAFNKWNDKINIEAEFIITTSDFLKKKLISEKNISENKIKVINGAPDEQVLKIDWGEKLSIKEKQAEGKEFFLCYLELGPATNWETLLKAFSIFKKWQQTSVQLLIAGRIESNYEDEFAQKIESYKYKSDVKLLDPFGNELLHLLQAAYALVLPGLDATGLNILNAFRAEVPVITSGDNIFHEAVSGAFLPAIFSVDELSRQMINLYRDERLRDNLVEKGKEILAGFSWAATSANWYDCLVRAQQTEFS